MATKINTANIEGYADMTAEQKLAALEAYEFEDSADALSQTQAELNRLKSANDKLSKENAEYKNKNRSQLSESEQKLAEMQDLIESQKATIDALNKTQRLTEMKASFLKRGYTDEQASAAAHAWEDGKIEDFLGQADAFVKAEKEKYKTELMNGTATPPASGGKVDANVDYSKLASEAQAAGNWHEASYYTRLAQEQNSNT